MKRIVGFGQGFPVLRLRGILPRLSFSQIPDMGSFTVYRRHDVIALLGGV